ncbi:putative sulfate exporter family transporter [Actinobacteria bacterium IMCC26103]|nr:putative sulfate exporter family transporter [Actinobacteria bacterium IMCC26103]
MIKTAPGLGLIAAVVAIAFQIHNFQPAISPLALCVAFGFAIANFAAWPTFATAGTTLASKKLMRIGVALLGAQVSVLSLKAIGVKGVITVILVVTFTIFGILALSKLFKMSGELGLLIGVGFGVCGATAVAAIRPQTRATEEETSYAIALISLCGTLSIFILPFLGHLLGLSDQTFGSWAGAAVHDVGQVIATASVWSDDAVKSAVVIKLARVCLLAPIVLILSVRHRRYLTSLAANNDKKNEITNQKNSKVPLIPFFVLGFIAVATVQNLFSIPTELHDAVVLISKLLLGAGLVALGSSVRWKSIRAIGPRPMIMGLIAWVIVAGVALAAVQITGL